MDVKYHLMNKDDIVASFIKSENEFEDTYQILSFEKEKLPIGFIDIGSWLDKGRRQNIERICVD